MRTTFAQIGLTVLMLTSASITKAAEQIIIDNKEAQFTGNWQVSKGSTQKYGDDYRFSSSTDTPEANSTAEFRPKISHAGRYDVDIWFASGENRSLLAPVVISCKSGAATFKVDEKRNGGKWVNVAKGQEFDSGISGFILVGNNTGATGSVVVADAIRLVNVGDIDEGHSVTLSPSVGGRLSKDPNKASFAAGSDVTIAAAADDGYVFAGWTGDATGMANPLTITVNKDKTIGATFVQGGVGAIVEASEAVYEGVWEQGKKQWGKPFSDPYFWTSAGKDTPKKASAVFTPDIPRPGAYDIYVWFVPGSNRSRSARFEISGKAGKEVVTLNQQTGGESWVLLAPGKEFEAGKKGFVRLTNDVDEQSSVVVADAIAFLYVGAANPGQTANR